MMFPQLNKVSTTSYFAIIVALGCFALLGYMCVRYGDDATTRTQIITGLLAALSFPAQYYFGQSKNRGQNGTNVQQADEVNVTTTADK